MIYELVYLKEHMLRPPYTRSRHDWIAQKAKESDKYTLTVIEKNNGKTVEEFNIMTKSTY